MQRQIDNQMKRIDEIDESIDQVTVIQRQMTPLVIRMIDGLEKFVELDVPFHMDERQQRIAFLRSNLDRSDVTVAEKFRQVLEAYKIESEYGRKIDAYKGSVEIERRRARRELLPRGPHRTAVPDNGHRNFGGLGPGATAAGCRWSVASTATPS